MPVLKNNNKRNEVANKNLTMEIGGWDRVKVGISVHMLFGK